jgi:ABC-type glycerol-3-phosphate transport system substrate-binding protein
MKKLSMIAAGVGVALAVSLAGCTSEPTFEDFESQEVTITLGNQPPAAQEAELAYYNERVDAFRAAHPNWTVETSEAVYDAQSFPAQLAAGNLPTVIGVPYSEMNGLIERGQVADVTAALGVSGLEGQLNEATLKIVQDGSGNVYGVPTDAYALGLAYNRALFSEAGLDPDDPPSTWDEVRDAARTITEVTGQPGFLQLTTSNQGGWILTAQTVARGGAMENEAGTEVTFDSDETRAALEYLRALRWEDDTMGSNFLLDATGVAQAFAAGQAGMFVIQSGAYQPLTELLGFPGEDFGFAAMPTLDEGADVVTLSGGNVEIINAEATEAQKVAALSWIDFFWLDKFRSEDAARADAQIKADQGTAVAIPGLPPVSEEQYTTYLEWIADLNNVPVENFAPYLALAKNQVVHPEPAVAAQELYAILDPVVQAVLTDENADIDALLAEAAAAMQAKLDR